MCNLFVTTGNAAQVHTIGVCIQKLPFHGDKVFPAVIGADIKCDFGAVAPIVVVTGFVASLASGTPTTLKRSGSDYSATIFARLMSASSITMWKNVNGVYTADPRRVPEAFPITSLKFDEAIEDFFEALEDGPAMGDDVAEINRYLGYAFANSERNERAWPKCSLK